MEYRQPTSLSGASRFLGEPACLASRPGKINKKYRMKIISKKQGKFFEKKRKLQSFLDKIKKVSQSKYLKLKLLRAKKK